MTELCPPAHKIQLHLDIISYPVYSKKLRKQLRSVKSTFEGGNQRELHHMTSRTSCFALLKNWKYGPYCRSVTTIRFSFIQHRSYTCRVAYKVRKVVDKVGSWLTWLTFHDGMPFKKKEKISHIIIIFHASNLFCLWLGFTTPRTAFTVASTFIVIICVVIYELFFLVQMLMDCVCLLLYFTLRLLTSGK